MDEAHDPKTAGNWRVHTTVCQACRVQRAQMENDAETKNRGLLYSVTRA